MRQTSSKAAYKNVPQEYLRRTSSKEPRRFLSEESTLKKNVLQGRQTYFPALVCPKDLLFRKILQVAEVATKIVFQHLSTSLNRFLYKALKDYF